MVYRLCQAYHALPEQGGVLDQSVEVLRMHAILVQAGVIEAAEQRPSAADDDPLLDLPMELLNA